jgi:hypothetical protein
MAARVGRGTWAVVAAAAIGALLLLAWNLTSGSVSEPSRDASENLSEGRGGGNEVLEELSEQTDERLEAVEEAKAEGIRWRVQTKAIAAAAPTPGWAGETVADPVKDDWEPAIAADPSAPFVYLMTTHFGDKPCPGNCPIPHISVHVSGDGGQTWAPQRPLCACKGSWQYDPVVEVVPNTGAVYAAYLNGFNVVFTKSTNHGQTWAAPVNTYGNVSWNDKPALAVSDDGRDVYLSWNGPTGGDPYIAQSHDFGQTWTQLKLVDSNLYYFAYDADVLHDGTVVFAESEIDYSGPGGAPVNQVRHHVFISRDSGATWEDHVVDTVNVGEPCVAEGCGPDFYIGHDALSADDAGTLVLLYDGASTNLGPQRIFSRRSTDAGRTWSARVALSVAGENATSPAVESRGNGDVRAWYMQTINGDDPDAWNVFYRSSANGGQTWTAPVLISDVATGTAYKHADGFDEVYGDYGEIAITNAGKTIATWGEGLSYNGPGGVWFNRQS